MEIGVAYTVLVSCREHCSMPSAFCSRAVAPHNPIFSLPSAPDGEEVVKVGFIIATAARTVYLFHSGPGRE